MVSSNVTLPEPFISGVDENNVIDKKTLTEDIIVLVMPYNNIHPYDRIYVHFGTYLRTGTFGEHINQPYVADFLPQSIPEGKYDVYYIAEDVTGNQSKSIIVTVTVIDSAHPASKPTIPAVEGAVDGTLDLSSLNVITVDIPSDGGNVQKFDALEVNIQNIAGTVSHSKKHPVLQDVNPHKVSFDIGGFSVGDWKVFYTRQRGGVTETSAVLTISMVSGVTPPVEVKLPAPLVPQATNGLLDLTFLTQPVIVEIPKYPSIKSLDKIQVYVGAAQALPHIVVQDTLTVHIQEVDPAIITLGLQDVYYTVTPFGGQATTSPKVSVNFIHKHTLKAPSLTGADRDHMLDMHTLTTDYVEMVIPAYEGIAPGDKIDGYIGNVMGEPHIVMMNELDHHTVHFPKASITVPSNQNAYYTVQSQAGGALETSPKEVFSFVERLKEILPAPYLNGHATTYNIDEAPGGYMPIYIDAAIWKKYSPYYKFTLGTSLLGISFPVNAEIVWVPVSSLIPANNVCGFLYSISTKNGHTIGDSQILVVNFIHSAPVPVPVVAPVPYLDNEKHEFRFDNVNLLNININSATWGQYSKYYIFRLEIQAVEWNESKESDMLSTRSSFPSRYFQFPTGKNNGLYTMHVSMVDKGNNQVVCQSDKVNILLIK